MAKVLSKVVDWLSPKAVKVRGKSSRAVSDEVDPDLKKRLDGIIARAKRQRDDWFDLYEDGIDYIFGNQLANITIKDGQSRIQDNQIFPAVTQEQSLINQNSVMVKALPFEKSDETGSKVWEPILHWQYEKNIKVPQQILSGVIDAKTHGHWVGRTLWNPRHRWDAAGNKWVGEVEFKLCRPDTVEFAPDTADPDKTEWVVEFDRMRLSQAQAEWPDMATRLEEEGVDDRAYLDRGNTGFGNTYEGQPDAGPQVNTDGRPSIEGRLANLLKGDTDEDEEVEDYVLVERIFFKDRATRRQTIKGRRFSAQELLDGGVAIEGPDPDDPDTMILFHAKTGEPITEENWPTPDERVEDVPLYPTYRSVCRCGDMVLHDKAWELDDHSYSLGVNLLLPHNWHGLNGVEMARTMQDVINRSAMSMEAWLRFAGLPVVVVEEGVVPACPDNNGVANHLIVKPGAIWKVAQNRSAGVRFLNVESMPNTVPVVRSAFLESLRDQTGVQEIGLGRESGGATATEAIRLETNTKLRTALQWKLVETWILRVMRRTQALCQKYYTAGEKRRIAGPNLDALIAEIDASAFDARFDLTLEVATSLPFDRERRKQEATQLYGVLGIPFLEQLLDAYERDDKADVLQKIAAYQQIVAMLDRIKKAQEQQAGAMTPAGGPTGETSNDQTVSQAQPGQGGDVAGYAAGASQGA